MSTTENRENGMPIIPADFPVVETIAPIIGRPSIYTQELADRICSELAEGKSLRTVCKPEDMPCKATVFNWLRVHKSFLDQYARAKEESADALIEEMLDIADDGSNDLMTITKGNQQYEMENKEVTNRSRLRVDTRKWIASKLKPKKYGDKIDMTTNGKDLPTPILSPIIENALPSNNSNAQGDADDQAHQGDTGGDIGIQNDIGTPLLDKLGTIG